MHDHKNYPGENEAILTPAPVDDVFGFYGTIQSLVGAEMAEVLWDVASLTLSSLFEEDDPAAVRNFLRSRYGRHLADEVSNQSRPSDYEDYDAMREAVIGAVLATDRKGRSYWRKWFPEIRPVTMSGEWIG